MIQTTSKKYEKFMDELSEKIKDMVTNEVVGEEEVDEFLEASDGLKDMFGFNVYSAIGEAAFNIMMKNINMLLIDIFDKRGK